MTDIHYSLSSTNGIWAVVLNFQKSLGCFRIELKRLLAWPGNCKDIFSQDKKAEGPLQIRYVYAQLQE